MYTKKGDFFWFIVKENHGKAVRLNCCPVIRQLQLIIPCWSFELSGLEQGLGSAIESIEWWYV